MVKSMPEASMASITSPEQGAQQECSNTFLWPSGGVRVGRSMGVVSALGWLMAVLFLRLRRSDGLFVWWQLNGVWGIILAESVVKMCSRPSERVSYPFEKIR